MQSYLKSKALTARYLDIVAQNTAESLDSMQVLTECIHKWRHVGRDKYWCDTRYESVRKKSF